MTADERFSEVAALDEGRDSAEEPETDGPANAAVDSVAIAATSSVLLNSMRVLMCYSLQ
jgi:hypothetical protein